MCMTQGTPSSTDSGLATDDLPCSRVEDPEPTGILKSRLDEIINDSEENEEKISVDVDGMKFV